MIQYCILYLYQTKAKGISTDSL
ncbi:hypothetical protein ACQ27_gp466 [Klebsiella phage K64-1]|nr:hypothetical protein ACQ27_gp466 [Klebsiella phage K64-1]